MAFDCINTDARDNLLKQLKQEGIHISGCGIKSVRLRPALIFEKKHADIFIKALNKVIENEN